MRRLFLFTIVILFTNYTFGQQLYISTGTNWFLPLSKGPYATMHPIYYRELTGMMNEKVLTLGGAQLSILYTRPFKKKIDLHYTCNLTRYTYWEAYAATDINALPAGVLVGGIGNYALLLSSTAQYKIAKNLTVGLGVGLNVGLYNYTSIAFVNSNSITKYRGQVNSTRVNPMIPLNIKWQPKRWLIGLEYNQALLSHHRTYANAVKGMNYGLLQVEIGYKILDLKKKSKQ